MIAVNYVLFEFVSYGLYRVKYGEYDRRQLQLERIQTIERIQGEFLGESSGDVIAGKRVTEVLHPYAGYTVDGKQLVEGCVRSDDSNPYDCFTRIRKPNDFALPKRAAGVLNVALLGGSVAVGTINGAPPEYYQKKLRELPEYQGFKINIHVLAAGGYRQPQPLMLLNHYYALGAEYDLIISLDAFNEVAIGSNEYKWTKTHPSFPRSWGARVAQKVRPQTVVLQAKKLQAQESHLARSRFLSNIWCRNSPVWNLVWKVVQSRYLLEESELNLSLNSLLETGDKPRDFLYEALGPDYDFQGWDSLLEYTAKIWARSNHLVHGVAEVHGARFFHFIQPNQYIEGAKPHMSEHERARAFAKPEQGGYGYWYRQGFPFVQQQHRWLREQGVHTVDLTYLYKDMHEPIYVDNCCHVNKKGSAMIIEAIVDTIHQANVTLRQTGVELGEIL